MMTVQVHELTNDPTLAWKKLSKTQIYQEIKLPVLDEEIPENMIRIVCMSDTHSHRKFQFKIPNGDIFIHAGDFTKTGTLKEVIDFNNWIGTLPHKHKLVIAGNHELSFDSDFSDCLRSIESIENVKQRLTNCTYLEDKSITLYGIEFYGTPWQPEFRKWAFNLPRGQQCLDKWNIIPSTVDVLISHGPPIGHGDLCIHGIRTGCVELLTTIQNRVKPKYHIFGHIHEGYGVTTDGATKFINASTCDIMYNPVNLPIVFDLEIATD